ncbi:MAG: threonylcarbamoyl-AMP synthase [Clostridiaceae bacterium]|nr:threonylcarbamoyl-AMP synthase [Clostridiaceae bacterium]
MNTSLLTTKDTDIARAAEILRSGGLVAFPTETVYGLGADALNEHAVQKIFLAKGRPADNPFIVHIADYELLPLLVSETPEQAKKLMQLYWPGPLTVVLKKRDKIPYVVTAGLDTVAIRMPSNNIARALLKQCNIPVAAPSANISGRPSTTTAEHVMQDLDGKIDAVIDGGCCNIGLESTVIDLSGDIPVLLRPGGITFEQLTATLGYVKQGFELVSGETPRSPGIKYRHYSPATPVIVVKGDFDKYINANAAKYKTVGVITNNKAQYPPNCIVKYLGESPSGYAANLFYFLRELDGVQAEVIFAPDIEDSGIGLAIQNRLYKAAGYKIVRGD